MNKKTLLSSLAGMVVAIVVGAYLLPLLFLPYPLIKPWLFYQVPVGSSEQQLRAEAKSNNWDVRGSWAVGADESRHPFWFLNAYEPRPPNARSIVWTSLGGYRVIFRTDYDSFWYFDENGRLIDVYFRKMIDAL